MRLAALAASAVLVLGGCASGEAVTGDRRNVGVVSVVFSARPARVQVGQVVRLQLRLVNNGGTPQEVAFDNGQRYDFWVELDGRTVWRWSRDRAFDAARHTLRLASQEPQTFVEPWTAEASGAYRVLGVVTADGFDRPLDGEVVVE